MPKAERKGGTNHPAQEDVSGSWRGHPRVRRTSQAVAQFALENALRNPGRGRTPYAPRVHKTMSLSRTFEAGMLLKTKDNSTIGKPITPEVSEK